MATDPAVRDHQAWLGYLQPDGLVVSAPALVDAQVLLDRGTLSQLQQDFLPFAVEAELNDATVVAIADFPAFVREFLGWPEEYLFGLDPSRPLPDVLTVPLPELGETLAPTFAFRDPRPKDATNPWLLLVQVLPLGTDLDAAHTRTEAQWSASAARRFERLLRETRVPIGVLTNGAHIRLLYAPRGENAGSLTFPVEAMTEVAGRPILGALHLLLHRYRLLSAPSEARLPGLLEKSRAYQSAVSTALAGQVLDALYELLRGFQAADEHTKGALLREVLAEHPDDVYAGLLTVLLRLVFLLYAEDRALMPTSALYVRHYAVHGLFERLRADYERYPDTMDHRYGAWPQLLALFRAVYGGSRHPQLKIPARKGYLFDPDRYRFLEGHPQISQINADEESEKPMGRGGDLRPSVTSVDLPLVADGVVFRVLRNLLLLDGERLSYRTLDVEEIGSVYQTIMGFRLEVVGGPSIAIVGKRKHKGEVPAPNAIILEELLAVRSTDRVKWLRERTDQEVTGEAERKLEAAATLDDLLAALERKIARNATPHVVPRGGLILQPTDERRRTGSHYTPRSFTEPIVRTTLRPILQRLGEHPTPAQILDLKICDLAVGSAAFLVETCRQLGDELVKAWHRHPQMSQMDADGVSTSGIGWGEDLRKSATSADDEVLHARRLVAQRCLYGVDRNPMAVDLAKLSLWLATLARDHPFTFLDHAIRCGDSLVGLTRKQLADFDWRDEPKRVLGQEVVEYRIRTATAYRKEILEADEFVSPELKRQKLDLADDALKLVRLAGDCVIAAFFAGDKDRERQTRRNQLLAAFTAPASDLAAFHTMETAIARLRTGQFSVRPFHWEIEFPEVFDRENGGFDAIVSNPPFAGKNTLLNSNRAGYLDWLKTVHEESHGNSDLVAHFFRRAFGLVRSAACFGLIATNTIGQGDTRHTGLRWVCTNGGTIYAARKRYKWPGQAAVVVSVVHVTKGAVEGPVDLDGKSVPIITAYLFHAGGHEDPGVLRANEGKSFTGSFVLGMGFTFDDTDTKGVANPIALMHELVAKDPRNAERIFPYIGGEEVNDSPAHAHHRYVINFGDMTEQEARRWPDLMRIVEEKVKPERLKNNREAYRRYWWQYAEKRGELTRRLTGLQRFLMHPFPSKHFAFAFLPSNIIVAAPHCVFALPEFSAFAVLQSRVHEVWTLFFASTQEDRLRYLITDCFQTFPFPRDFETNAALEQAGREYYECRAALMVKNNEGPTNTYNRFHDPNETSPDILRLRELHAAMDRAVLNAYGWNDLHSSGEPPSCEFLLDYEEDEDEEGTSRRRKPWRYRWPDDIRDEVLARLLALNAQRAEEERLSGERAEKPQRRRGRNARSAQAAPLFELAGFRDRGDG